MLNLGDKLYSRLPSVYKSEDAKLSPNPYQLKRFLQVIGEGYNDLEQNIIDYTNIYNVDKCPAPLLPLLAQTYGLEFPYSMDEATQRKFIKIIPKLYVYKGTDTAFKFLAREIFGQGTVTTTTVNTKPEEMSDLDWINSGEWQKIFANVEMDGETLFLNNKQFNFIKFCEILRPANRHIIPNLTLFYRDTYDFFNKVSFNDAQNDYVMEKWATAESFNKAGITETEKVTTLTPAKETETVSMAVDSTTLADTVTETNTDTRGGIIYDEEKTATFTPSTDSETYTNPDNDTTNTSLLVMMRTPTKLVSTTSKLVTNFRLTDYTPLDLTLDY